MRQVVPLETFKSMSDGEQSKQHFVTSKNGHEAVYIYISNMVNDRSRTLFNG